MQAIRDLVADDFASVNKLIDQKLYSRVGMVEDISHYITEAGGKRLRPLLTLLSANALNYKGNKHIELAVIIEFIHTATLLHDDVVDLSMLRRGKPTANANWGNAPSILVGDFIYSRSFQMLVELGNMEIMALLSDTTNQLAEGEVFQLSKAGCASTTREEYFQIITDKTAILFAAAIKGAAIIANASVEVQNALHEYGMNLGIAFQLADDILDYEGESETLGKNIGEDLSEGKPTLPLIYSIEKGNAEIIIQAIENKSAQHLSDIISIVKTNGAIEHCKEQAEKYVQAAKKNLEILEESEYKNALIKIADFVMDRNS